MERKFPIRSLFDYDRTDDVPEMHRKDGYIYVPAGEWDRRVTGNND